MKNKVVVWGTNENNEKVLIALELRPKESNVLLYTFPEAIVSEAFLSKMMDQWREDKPVEFPEGHTLLDRDLSVTESLLPENLKVERSDVIQRAQTEWHFVVLSSKLHQAYQQELAEFKEKIQALTAYDGKMFEELRTFWGKVQNQSRERNLFRQHADSLRDNINALFEDLKTLRSQVNNEFMSASKQLYDQFVAQLDDVEARIQAGGSKLSSVFDDLKKMQSRYRESKLSNEHRNQIWDRMDAAFKAAKERKFGAGVNDGSVVDRQNKRLNDLNDVIKRMEQSIRRDEEDLAFQRKKVDTTEGQLEAQIRMAKIKMIEERVNSKREKIEDMKATRASVEQQVNSIKEKESRRAEKEADKKKYEAAREAVKSEIAADIKAKSSPKQDESLVEAATTVLGDVLMDALDSMKAVAAVVVEKAEEAVQAAVVKADEFVEELTKKAEPEADAPSTEAAEAVEQATEEVVSAAETASGEEATTEAEKAAKPKRASKKAAPEMPADTTPTEE
jgi:hypothetical protein